MSEENVETVRRHTEAWNRRDLTTWLALFHRDGEIDWSRSRGPLKGVYCGEGELEVFWDAFWSTFEDIQVEMHGFTEAWKATLLALGSGGRAEDRRAGSGGRTAARCAGWRRIRTIETPEVTHLSYRIATTDRSAA